MVKMPVKLVESQNILHEDQQSLRLSSLLCEAGISQSTEGGYKYPPPLVSVFIQWPDGDNSMLWAPGMAAGSEMPPGFT